MQIICPATPAVSLNLIYTLHNPVHLMQKEYKRPVLADCLKDCGYFYFVRLQGK